MAEIKTYFYQVEAKIGDEWVPVNGHTYACARGYFRRLLNLLSLAPGQRIRRVGDIRNYPEANGWKPAYIYSPTHNGLRDWPIK
jgi:hypothetical protein